MPVKFSGNTIRKFGTTLPTLYFEKIKIFDDHVSVKVAMYVEANEGEDDTWTLYTDHLQQLNYYLMFIVEGEVSPIWLDAKTRFEDYYPPDEILGAGTHRLQQLINGNKTVFDLARYGPSQYIGNAASGVVYGPADVFVHEGEMATAEFDVDISNSKITGDLDMSGTAGKVVLYPKLGSHSQNFKMFNFPDDFDLDNTEILYNSNGSLIHKFVATIDLIAGVGLGPGPLGWGWSTWNFIRSFHRLREVSMVAFTSPLEIGENDVGISKLKASRENKGRARLYEAQVSDATYEKMTHYGEVLNEPILVYVTPNGEEYDGSDPIQAITGLYYGNTEVTLSEIASGFKEFIGTGISNNTTIQNMYDNLNYILEVHGNSADLLPQLNHFRKTFPAKSTTTPGGRMYEKVKIMIYNANVAIERGTTLMRKLIKSPVVKDHRTESPLPWIGLDDAWEGGAAPGVNHAMALNYINTSMVLASKFSSDPEPAPGSVGSDTDLEDVAAGEWRYGRLMDIYTSGYWFFDYERAIRKATNLSRLLPIKKIESWFGQALLNSNFKLTSTSRRRYRRNNNTAEYFVNSRGELQLGTGGITSGRDAKPDLTDIGTTDPGSFPDQGLPDAGSAIDKLELSPPYISKSRTTYSEDGIYPELIESSIWASPTYKTTGGDSAHNPYGGGTWAAIDTGVIDAPRFISTDETQWGIKTGEATYDCLRNFEFLDGLNIDGKPYRLMAMEYQDVSYHQSTEVDYEPTFNDFFTFSVVCRDTTMDIYHSLVGAFDEMANGQLREYVEGAADYCSYNSTEGYFNDFFVKAMAEKYEADPERAPWILAPTIYHFHLDLLTDAHGGSRDRIVDAAIRDSELINPTTGRLETVQIFWQKFKDFYTYHYEGSTPGSIGSMAPEMENKKRVFGSFGVDEGNIAFYPLPELMTDYLLGAHYVEPATAEVSSGPRLGTCLPGYVWVMAQSVGGVGYIIPIHPYGADVGSPVALQVSSEFYEHTGGACINVTTGLPFGMSSWEEAEELRSGDAPEPRGEVRMVKMAFGFKKIPEGGNTYTTGYSGCSGPSAGERSHVGDGRITIRLAGTQTLPDGSNATDQLRDMTPGSPKPSESTSLGSTFKNSRWNYEAEGCRPASEKVRTVYLPAGIEYYVTWTARDGCSGAGTVMGLIHFTKKIRVPSGVEHAYGEFTRSDGASAVVNSGYRVGGGDYVSGVTNNTYYVLRANCENSTNGYGVYAKAPESQWGASIYENDSTYWNKSAKKWRGNLP
tara:strand:+ start:890 stop:4663 length:3774 start_codon:yes stop_codon:yes gene_type:complete